MKKIEKTVQNRALEEAALRYCRDKSEHAKKDTVNHAGALINYYASLYSPGKVDEDLRQAGYLGLLKGLERFKPDKGVLFSTYASHCIIGEIKHELRDRGIFKIPEWMKGLQAKIIEATEELAQKNSEMPTLREIAKRVNVAEEGIIEAMQAGYVRLEELDLSKVRHLRYESFKLPIEDKIAVQMSLEKMDNL